MDISIYDVITSETAQQVKAALLGNRPVSLHINSPGGSVADALAIYTLLRKHPAPVTAYVDGLCASAATLVALGAGEVVMAEHSLMMVHNPWTVAQGDADDMRRTAEALDKAGTEMAALYADRAGINPEAAEAVMKKETWFNAYEAVDAGFAHRVEEVKRDKPRLAAKALTFLATVVKDSGELEKAQQRKAESKSYHNQKIAALVEPFKHINAVKNMQESGNMPQQIEQVRAELMNALGRDTTPSDMSRSAGAFAYVDNGNTVRDCMIDALNSRLGLAALQDKTNPYRIMSMLDMARASLTDRGAGVASYGTKMQMVGAAFTHSTSDFGNVLMSVSEKAMLRGWMNSGETFPRWTKKGELTNFHQARRVGLSGFPSLPRVAEGAEYTYVSTGDSGSPIALATYGALFGITRQAIINDDLSAFSQTPANLGRAASRTIGDLVYSILTGNGKFTDGKALFHADHGNLQDTAQPVATALAELRKQMRLQTNNSGETLNIAPAFVIVPAALETEAIQALQSTSVAGEVNSGVINPVNGLGELIVESRLDKSSAQHWYVAAEQGSDTIEVAYLDGIDIPYLEQQQGWTVDGVSFKVRIDAGVAPLDYRGLARGKGAV